MRKKLLLILMMSVMTSTIFSAAGCGKRVDIKSADSRDPGAVSAAAELSSTDESAAGDTGTGDQPAVSAPESSGEMVYVEGKGSVNDPVSMGEWLPFRYFSATDMDFHDAEIRITGVENDSQAAIDAFAASGNKDELDPGTNPDIGYRLLDYEIQFADEGASYEDMVTLPELNVKGMDGKVLRDEGMAYIGLSYVLDVTAPQEDSGDTDGDTGPSKRKAVFIMPTNAPDYLFEVKYQDSDGDYHIAYLAGETSGN